jgi:hypothetical protein
MKSLKGSLLFIAVLALAGGLMGASLAPKGGPGGDHPGSTAHPGNGHAWGLTSQPPAPAQTQMARRATMFANKNGNGYPAPEGTGVPTTVTPEPTDIDGTQEPTGVVPSTEPTEEDVTEVAPTEIPTEIAPTGTVPEISPTDVPTADPTAVPSTTVTPDMNQPLNPSACPTHPGGKVLQLFNRIILPLKWFGCEAHN